jgi:hypothetical protein
MNCLHTDRIYELFPHRSDLWIVYTPIRSIFFNQRWLYRFRDLMISCLHFESMLHNLNQIHCTNVWNTFHIHHTPKSLQPHDWRSSSQIQLMSMILIERYFCWFSPNFSEFYFTTFADCISSQFQHSSKASFPHHKLGTFRRDLH